MSWSWRELRTTAAAEWGMGRDRDESEGWMDGSESSRGDYYERVNDQ
jgi:hypothetical protein